MHVRTALAASLVLALAACAGSPPPPATSATEVTSASRPMRMTNGTGRPDAEVAPVVKRALDEKKDARFVFVPILEPATQLAGDLSVAVRLEVRAAKDDALLGTVRRTASKPGAALGDRAAEDELLQRAVAEAADDALAHADAFTAPK